MEQTKEVQKSSKLGHQEKTGPSIWKRREEWGNYRGQKEKFSLERNNEKGGSIKGGGKGGKVLPGRGAGASCFGERKKVGLPNK